MVAICLKDPILWIACHAANISLLVSVLDAIVISSRVILFPCFIIQMLISQSRTVLQYFDPSRILFR